MKTSISMGRWEAGFTSQDLTPYCKAKSNAKDTSEEPPNGAMGWLQDEFTVKEALTSLAVFPKIEHPVNVVVPP